MNTSSFLIVGLFLAWIIYKQIKTRMVKKRLPELLRQGATIIDVREESEFQAGHYPGSVNVPMSRLNSSLTQVPLNKPVILCCASGTRSGMAAMVLNKKKVIKKFIILGVG
jgi:phage shock protein E